MTHEEHESLGEELLWHPSPASVVSRIVTPLEILDPA
jgi:hypothetical protein